MTIKWTSVLHVKNELEEVTISKFSDGSVRIDITSIFGDCTSVTLEPDDAKELKDFLINSL